MQAAQAEQEAVRLKIEEDCRKQTEAFEVRFSAVGEVVKGLMGNLQKIEASMSGLQGQVAESRRVHEASTEAMMAMMKKLMPDEDGKEPKAPARSAARRAASDSPDDARGRSRSKERRLAEKKAKAAKDGTSSTD